MFTLQIGPRRLDGNRKRWRVTGKIRTFVLTAPIFLFALAWSGWAEEPYAREEWAHIINLAGRERMLTQKMAKEMLFIAAGIRVEENRLELEKTAAIFEKNLDVLQNGDEESGLLPAKNIVTKNILCKVDRLWSAFKSVVEETLHGGNPSIENIATLNLPLLEKMELAVQLMKKDAERETGWTGGAVIDCVGRERMLTQKIAKECLLAYLKFNPKENAGQAIISGEWFAATLKALTNGGLAPIGDNLFASVPSASDPAILGQLNRINSLWEEFKPFIAKVTLKDMEGLAAGNLILLEEVDKLVEMFQGTSGLKANSLY